MQFTQWAGDYKSISEQWSTNNQCSPDSVSRGSDKKVWWKCDKGHEWQTTILSRINLKSGCPYCSGRFATEFTSLLKVRPDIASEWNFDKNTLTPSLIATQSNKKVWWKCGSGHEWQALVCNRTKIDGTGCPYCAGKLPTKDNCLAKAYPQIAQDWHPINGFSPNDILPKSSKKVWWICKNGHKYKAVVSSRTGSSNSGCPLCAWQTSKLEIRVYCELKAIFQDVSWKDRSLGFEIDVLLPNKKLAIEIDGWYWHKDKLDKDIKKNKLIEQYGLIPIRLRGLPLDLIGTHDIAFKKSASHKLIIQSLFEKISTLLNLHSYYDITNWLNDSEFQKLVIEKKEN
jgi:hypothetical protein